MIFLDKASFFLKKLDIRLLILIFSTYLTTFAGDLYYYSISSPDFPKYSIYFDYFNGLVERTNLEQNLSYYFLHSLNLSFKNKYIYEYNFQSLFDSNIVMTNNIFYICGILGTYKLLNYFKFNKNNIFFALVLLNFFPPIFGSRLIYKPEILIFAILPWIVYSFELYKTKKLNSYLICVFFLGIFLFTIKPTSSAMCGIFLLYRYKNLIFNEFKKMILLLIVTLIIFLPLILEDFNSNGYFYLNHPNEEVYSDQAPLNFLYNINFKEIITKPYQHNHADSLLGITLLDTFGDYYHLLWENDSSLFKYNEYRISDNFFISNFLEKYIGIFLTSLFYSSIIFYSLKDKKYSNFYSLPFFGIFVLLIISYTGNFQLQTGDVLKTSYYSFFLGLSFCFLIIKIFENKSFQYKILFSVIFTLLNSYIVGFPKINNSLNIEYLSQNNVSPLFCPVNDFFISDGSHGCRKYLENVCEFKVEHNDVNFIRSDSRFVNNKNEIDNNSFEYSDEIPHLVKGDSKLKPLDKNDCIDLLERGYQPIDKNYDLNIIPYFNLTFLMLSFSAILFLQLKKD